MVAVTKLTQERRREMTRDALVAAARSVFAKKGFNGASLDEIAEEAGFTRGAIYSNFDGKEDLLVAVLEKYNQDMLGPYGAMLQEHADDDEHGRSAAAAEIWTTQFRADPEIESLWLELNLYAMRNPSFRPKLAEFTRRNNERIAGFLEQNAEVAGIRPLLPATDIASIALAASSGLQQQATLDPENPERYAKLAEEVFSLLAHLFEAIPEEERSGGGGR